MMVFHMYIIRTVAWDVVYQARLYDCVYYFDALIERALCIDTRDTYGLSEYIYIYVMHVNKKNFPLVEIHTVGDWC